MQYIVIIAQGNDLVALSCVTKERDDVFFFFKSTMPKTGSPVLHPIDPMKFQTITLLCSTGLPQKESRLTPSSLTLPRRSAK